MPILDVSLSAAPSPDLAARAASALTDLTARLLRKRPEVTAVAVRFVDPAHWFAGGPSLAAQGKRSFFLDVRVVDGTNTKDEMAAYVAEVFRAMEALLPGLHEESYVHVHEVAGYGYGYGGLTQEHRYVRGTTAGGRQVACGTQPG